MATKLLIAVSTNFVGMHRWLNAPEDVKYLRDFHRHLFGVKVFVKVGHGDREVEFHTLKARVDAFLDAHYRNRTFELSCEQIAEHLLNHFGAEMVEVSEDGENSGFAVRTGPEPVGSLDKLREMAARLAAKGPVKEGEVVTDEVSGHKFKVTSVVQDSVTLDKVEPGQAGAKPDAVVEANPCFVGVEAEGPHRGAFTLFVPGRTTREQFVAALNTVVERTKSRDLRVYYGAGNDRKLSAATLGAILTRFSPNHVTIEVDKFGACDTMVLTIVHNIEDSMSGTRLTIVSMCGHDANLTIPIWAKAVDGGKIVWWGRYGKFTCRKDDPLFLFDTPVDKLGK